MREAVSTCHRSRNLSLGSDLLLYLDKPEMGYNKRKKQNMECLLSPFRFDHAIFLIRLSHSHGVARICLIFSMYQLKL